MRIIAGIAKGMQLAVPRGGNVRPTSDRVRGAIFSSLGAHVVGARVLDLYAGTGAFGLEAASRGAEAVTFVEQSTEAIQKTIAGLQRNRGVRCEFEVLRGDVASQLRRLTGPFSLIFADPPYETDPSPLLQASRPLLASEGLFVLETGKRTKLDAGLASGGAGLLWELQREAT